MLLPKYYLRQQRLQRALVEYPIYDPPYKTAERLLPKEQALENFRYFMDVRQERVRNFNIWLKSKFGVDANFEKKGIENALEWAADYIPIIMPSYDFWQTCLVFATYAKPWSGEYAGANAFFDFGAMLGEAFIHHRPNLRWQMEWSLSDYPDIEQSLSKETLIFLRSRVRDIRDWNRSEVSGYRRPILASAADAVEYESPYDSINTYFGLEFEPTTIEYAIKTRSMPKGLRAGNSMHLKEWIDLALTRSNNSQMMLVKERQQSLASKSSLRSPE